MFVHVCRVPLGLLIILGMFDVCALLPLGVTAIVQGAPWIKLKTAYVLNIEFVVRRRGNCLCEVAGCLSQTVASVAQFKRS